MGSEICIMHKRWSVFQIVNGLGMLLGTLLALFLAWESQLSLLLVLALTLAGVLAVLALALVSKLLVGEEYLLNNYRLQIVLLLGWIALLWLLRQPVLSYLDLLASGLGLSIAVGRIGCLAAGCCHGRPARRGVCYGQVHVDDGFEAYLAGVRLFPVQALAALWMFFVTAVGVLLTLGGAPPGTALSWYAVAYGVGRFFQEFLRGDAGRLYLLEFSEAQWTALAAAWAVVGAGWAGWLPFYGEQLGAAIGLTLAMAGVAVWRRLCRVPRHRLLHPNHIAQVAQILDHLSQVSQARLVVEGDVPTGATFHLVPMLATSLGIQLSAGEVVQEDGFSTRHYTLSGQNGLLTERTAAVLAELIARLRHPASTPQIVRGQQEGVYHVVMVA